ncbi:hypothetical protein VZT92_026582 [Zoarces viviparus]|uniref:SCAN box domain-containing protein n=1 Tax=Zoarces viviparus TaxID=48416 RepID=A0AAW1E150_ZOAVI
MDRLGLSPEDHQRRFREARLGPEDRPFAYAQWLKDAGTRWLQPEGPGDTQEAIEKVVLEQFVGGAAGSNIGMGPIPPPYETGGRHHPG